MVDLHRVSPGSQEEGEEGSLSSLTVRLTSPPSSHPCPHVLPQGLSGDMTMSRSDPVHSKKRGLDGFIGKQSLQSLFWAISRAVTPATFVASCCTELSMLHCVLTEQCLALGCGQHPSESPKPQRGDSTWLLCPDARHLSDAVSTRRPASRHAAAS